MTHPETVSIWLYCESCINFYSLTCQTYPEQSCFKLFSNTDKLLLVTDNIRELQGYLKGIQQLPDNVTT